MQKLASGNFLLDVPEIMKHLHILSKMKIADLGCGSGGHFVIPASYKVGKNGKVYAVDILKTVLEVIDRMARQENINNIETVWSNLEVFRATKIPSTSLDIALLINTLYLSKHRVEILREAIRLIKRKGKLIVIEWENADLPIGPSAEDRVIKENLILGCKKMGLSLEEEFNPGPYHYGLIFEKA